VFELTGVKGAPMDEQLYNFTVALQRTSKNRNYPAAFGTGMLTIALTAS
jgi:hypothetical protein